MRERERMRMERKEERMGLHDVLIVGGGWRLDGLDFVGMFLLLLKEEELQRIS